jgi:hypothetical protein
MLYILPTVLVFSPVFGRFVNYTSELGGIVRNETGEIVQANSVLLRLFAKINETALSMGSLKNDFGTGEVVDENNLMWESQLVKLLTDFPLPEGLKMYFRVARRFVIIYLWSSIQGFDKLCVFTLPQFLI